MPFIFGGFSCSESNLLTKSKKDRDYGTGTSSSETMAKKELDHVAHVSDFQTNLQKNGDPEGNPYDRLNIYGACGKYSCPVPPKLKIQVSPSVKEEASKKTSFHTKESRSDARTRVQLYSELDHSSQFTWEITNFFRLPVNEGYLIDSENFSFANASWCLRMYPNGKNRHHSGWIHLLLVRLNSYNLAHRIHYKLGLKTRRDRKKGSLTHAVTFYANAAVVGFVNLIQRSDVLRKRKLYAQKDILTVFCEIFMIEEVTVPLSNHTLLLKPPSEIQSLETLEHAQKLCLQSALSNPEFYIWKIDNFAELPMDDGFFIESAKFSVANATWCMRMYPNGQKGLNKGWIQLFLVRLCASNSEHRIHCRLGIQTRGNRELSSSIHDVTFNTNAVEMGVMNLLRRSDSSSRKKLLMNGTLTAFCHIYKMEEFVLSNNALAVKQFEPSSKIPLVKKPEYSNFRVGVLEKHSFLDAKDVIWKIPSFSIEPMEVSHWRESPVFSFLNEYWCLRIYANATKNGKIDSRKIQMYLVRFKTCSLMYVITYELSILDSCGSWRKFKTKKCKGIFQDTAMKLGTSKLHFASDGFVTIYFQMLSNEELTDASMLTEQPTKNFEFPLNYMEQWRDGVLYEQPFLAATEVTWEIPDFFKLKEEVEDNIKSPVFDFAGDTWLQLYPNGYDKTAGEISFVLVRLFPSTLKCHVVCHFSIKNYVNINSRCKLQSVILSESTKSDPAHLKQSEIMEKPDEYVSKGILTVLCQMYMIQDNEEHLQPKPFEPVTDLSMNQFIYGLVFQQTFLAVKEITWKIPDFFSLDKDRYYVNSPVFGLANDNWLLKLYPNGCETTAGKISLVLVRLFPSDLNHRVICKFSIKNNNDMITYKGRCESTLKDKVIKISPVHLSHFKTTKKQEDVPNHLLTVFCQIFIIDDNNEAVVNATLEMPQPKPLTVLPLNNMEQYRRGVLSQQSFLAATEVTWKIPGFLRLEKKTIYFIDSPMFGLANDTWLLELYPNGCENTKGKISCFLVRFSSSKLVHQIICKFGIMSSNNRITESGSCESTFRDEVIKSCPVHLNKSKVMTKLEKNVPEGILTLFCQILIMDDKREAVVEAPLQIKLPEPVTSKDLCTDAVVDLKENANNASFSEGFNSIPHEMVLKDEVNILAGEKVVDKDFDELDFTLLKKKKRKINDQPYMEYHKRNEVKLEKNTDLVKKSTPLFEEIKSSTQEMGSKDDGYCIEEGKVIDVTFGDVDLKILKQEKKSNSQLKVEYPIEKNRNVAKLERDHVMDTVIDLKQDNSSLFKELKNNTQKTDQKDEGNVITKGRVVDEFDSTLQKEERAVKSDLCEVEYYVQEEKNEQKLAVDNIQQDYRDVPCCDKDYDVRFFVKGEELREHSAIFKDQSTYFTPIFEHEITKGSSVVVIDHSDPQIFKVFLRYLYSGHVALTSENVFSLCSIANKYGVQKLRTECLQYMKSTLSGDTVWDFVAFSLQQEEAELLEFAADFMSKNVMEISWTPKWQTFLNENYSSAKELLMKMLERHTNFL